MPEPHYPTSSNTLLAAIWHLRIAKGIEDSFVPDEIDLVMGRTLAGEAQRVIIEKMLTDLTYDDFAALMRDRNLRESYRELIRQTPEIEEAFRRFSPFMLHLVKREDGPRRDTGMGMGM